MFYKKPTWLIVDLRYMYVHADPLYPYVGFYSLAAMY